MWYDPTAAGESPTPASSSLFAHPKHGVHPDHTASNSPPSWLTSVALFTEAPLSLSRHRRRSPESSSLSVLYHSHSFRIVVAVSFLQVSQWLVPSKQRVSPPEERPRGSSLPPRLRGSRPPPPEE